MEASNGTRQPRVVVIGAGFGGLGVGIELLRAGFTDLTVLEQADSVGGVWRDNTYPQAACDVPSSLYSWSWAPNPDWGHRYSRQDEILAYLESAAAEAGILDRVRTGVTVTGASYDDATGRWTVRTSTGEEIEADVLVPALGQLSRPAVPDLPGRASFTGPAFHSARWDHGVDLRGKRVAVVGTGASAIQFVPGDRGRRRLPDRLPALGAVRPAEARPGVHPRSTTAPSPASRPASASAGGSPGWSPSGSTRC